MAVEHELAGLDATAQAGLVRDGELSATELVEHAIARLERHNPALNAVIRRDFERARERARSVVAGDDDAPPFAGVPTLLKDIGAAEAGQPCYSGMAALQRVDHREPRDSYFVRKLLAGGFIPLGRTNLPELALVATTEPAAFGATRNPWSLEHSAGGSSGGSAAAVAAGIVPVAHASDGGGSIRGPASMCALVGLKPSRGRCSFGPQRAERWSGLSVELMLTRSVRDCAALLDLLAGPMPGDPYHAPPPARPYKLALGDDGGKLRIGVLAHGPRGVELDPGCEQAVSEMARTLEQLGHDVQPVYPEALDEPETPLLWVELVACNVARALDAAADAVGRALTEADVEPLTWALCQHGRSVAAPKYLQTLEKAHAFGRRLCAFFEHRCELLLTPTQAAPPPRLGYLSSTPQEPFRALLRSAPYGVFTLPFNMSGQPAISLPTTWTADGLPLGTQLVAAFGREDRLLRVAAQLERARPWAGRRPAVFG